MNNSLNSKIKSLKEIEQSKTIENGRRNYREKLKIKLATVIPMFVMSICFIIAGVLALPIQMAKFQEKFTFVYGSAINVTISGSVSGAQTNASPEVLSFLPNITPEESSLESWNNTLDFASSRGDILFGVTIANNGGNPLNVLIETSFENESSNLKIVISEDGEFQISPGQSRFITLNFSIKNKTVAVKNPKCNFKITLS